MKQFKELISDKYWKSYDEYLKIYKDLMKEDIRRSIERRKELNRAILKETGIKVNKVNPELLKTMKNDLFTNTSATDGALNRIPTSSGEKYRIGIVTVAYHEKQPNIITCHVSDSQLVDDIKDIKEYFRNLEEISRQSELLVSNLMLYKERLEALRSGKKWKMVNGRLLPLHLRMMRIPQRPLEFTLELLEKLLKDKRVIGVVEKPPSRYVAIGSALNVGEYVILGSVSDYMKIQMEPQYRNEEERKIGEEIIRLCQDFVFGVYRMGVKPFLFEVHRDFVKEGIHIICGDSMIQSFRGYPMLLDYADSIAKSRFSNEEFQKLFMSTLAEFGYIDFGVEQSEFFSRRR